MLTIPGNDASPKVISLGQASATSSSVDLPLLAEAGLPAAEVCRKHGLSPATFYQLKAKYGGLEVSDAWRLRHPENENSKLKRRARSPACVDIAQKRAPGGRPGALLPLRCGGCSVRVGRGLVQ